MSSQSWRDEAACQHHDPSLWFPTQTGASKCSAVAKLICHTCPVEVACLDYALRHDERWGIWGGKGEDERQVLRRRPQARA